MVAAQSHFEDADIKSIGRRSEVASDVNSGMVDKVLRSMAAMGGLGGRGDRAHSIARLWVPISSPLTTMFHLLPFSSYLAGSKSVSVRPLRPAAKIGVR